MERSRRRHYSRLHAEIIELTFAVHAQVEPDWAVADRAVLDERSDAILLDLTPGACGPLAPAVGSLQATLFGGAGAAGTANSWPVLRSTRNRLRSPAKVDEADALSFKFALLT